MESKKTKYLPTEVGSSRYYGQRVFHDLINSLMGLPETMTVPHEWYFTKLLGDMIQEDADIVDEFVYYTQSFNPEYRWWTDMHSARSPEERKMALKREIEIRDFSFTKKLKHGIAETDDDGVADLEAELADLQDKERLLYEAKQDVRQALVDLGSEISSNEAVLFETLGTIQEVTMSVDRVIGEKESLQARFRMLMEVKEFLTSRVEELEGIQLSIYDTLYDVISRQEELNRELFACVKYDKRKPSYGNSLKFGNIVTEFLIRTKKFSLARSMDQDIIMTASNYTRKYDDLLSKGFSMQKYCSARANEFNREETVKNLLLLANEGVLPYDLAINMSSHALQFPEKDFVLERARPTGYGGINEIIETEDGIFLPVAPYVNVYSDMNDMEIPMT